MTAELQDAKKKKPFTDHLTDADLFSAITVLL